MRALSTLVLLSAALSASAAVRTYHFEFTVQVDKDEPIVVSATLPPGTRNTLQANGRISFEVETPLSVGESSVTVVRIIDSSSGIPVVRDTSRRQGSVETQRRFTYLVCGSNVTFISPTPAQTKTCGT
jgi:hypothetical protein